MCGFWKRCIGFDPKHSKKWPHAKDSRFLAPVCLRIIRLQYGRTTKLISVSQDRLGNIATIISNDSFLPGSKMFVVSLMDIWKLQ